MEKKQRLLWIHWFSSETVGVTGSDIKEKEGRCNHTKKKRTREIEICSVSKEETSAVIVQLSSQKSFSFFFSSLFLFIFLCLYHYSEHFGYTVSILYLLWLNCKMALNLFLKSSGGALMEF